MLNISTNKGKTSKIRRNFITIIYPRVEMGNNHNRFCPEITKNY